MRKKNKSERKLRDRERMGEMKEEIFRNEKDKGEIENNKR